MAKFVLKSPLFPDRPYFQALLDVPIKQRPLRMVERQEDAQVFDSDEPSSCYLAIGFILWSGNLEPELLPEPKKRKGK